MTKTQELEYGMSKKWQRHFVGRWRLLAQWSCMGGSILILLILLLWSQFLYKEIFNSVLRYELVLDREDQLSDHWTYNDFEHKHYGKGTNIHMMYLWSVSDPELGIDEYGAGFRPDVMETGPYAVKPIKHRYDITFSDDDSSHVTYKEWNYYEEVTDPSVCQRIWLRTNAKLAKFYPVLNFYTEIADGMGKCKAAEFCKRCASMDDMVTVLNTPFVRLMHEQTPNSLVSKLAQESFSKSKEYLTENFAVSLKGHQMELAHKAVFSYRKAVALSRLYQNALDQIVRVNGTEAAMIAATRETFETNVDCEGTGIEPEEPTAVQMGYPRCPWGAGSYVRKMGTKYNTNGTARLRPEEAAFFLGPANASGGYSFLNDTTGVALWVGAARHLAVIDEIASVFPESADPGPYYAFNALVNATHSLGYSRDYEDSMAKVAGFTHLLFEVWLPESKALAPAASAEWINASTPADVVCDVGGYESEWRTPVAGVDHLYTYVCNWPLHPHFDYYEQEVGADAIAKVPIENQTMTELLISTDEIDKELNELSVYLDQNRILWYSTYQVCNMTMAGMPLGCSDMEEDVKAALETMPWQLADRSGVLYSEFLNKSNGIYDRYQGLACAISAWTFDNWAQNNRWMDEYLSAWFQSRFHESYDFTADNLEDLGYAQFAGGYVTEQVFTFPGVANIQRYGWWKTFAPENYHYGTWSTKTTQEEGIVWQVGHGIEFQFNAIKKGFLAMNLTVSDGKLLLDLLSSKSDDAFAFRRHVIAAHTTWKCDDYSGDDAYVYSDSTERDLKCEPGSEFFVVWNGDANFTWEARDKKYDPVGMKYETATYEEIVSLCEVLDKAFESDVPTCDALQEMFDDCDLFVDDDEDAVEWVTNCDMYDTLPAGNPSGIYCGYGVVEKRGNIVGHMLHAYAFDLILKDGGLMCANGDSRTCDFMKGGLYTTQKARDVLFEGYVDPIAVKFLNYELAERNLTIVCKNQTVRSRNEICGEVYEPDCTEGGFHIIYSHNESLWYDNETVKLGPNGEVFTATGMTTTSTYVNTTTYERRNQTITKVILDVDRSGENLWHWYSPELELPHGLGIVKNPVFALYQGQLWQNETFHRQRECEHRILNGPKNKFASCEITEETGRGEILDVGNVVKWYGNATLEAAPGAGELVVRGSRGAQYQPYLWDGFYKYETPYLFGFSTVPGSGGYDHTKGTRRKGNKTITVFHGDQLMVFNMKPFRSADADIVHMDPTIEWPRMWYNTTPEFEIKLNRYVEQRADWEQARNRSGANHKDFLGMPYSAPKGFVSAEILAGFPLFYGSVRHWANQHEWSELCDASNGRCFGDAQEYLKMRTSTSGDLAWKEYQQWVYGEQGNVDPPWQYRSFIDVDPVTGYAARSVRRMQTNLRVERSSLFPYLLSDNGRCNTPSAYFIEEVGYGCMMFHPLAWIEDNQYLDYETSARIYYGYFQLRHTIFITFYTALTLGALMIIFGGAAWHHYNRKERKFKARIYLD